MLQATSPQPTGADVIEVSSVAPQTGRLTSLDVFRGLTLAGMVLVNNPGSWDYVYDQLEHAPWHGWTATDLVFPFFIFMVGVSMVFSFAKEREKGASRSDLMLKSAKRAAILFLIGVALNTYPWWEAELGTARIPGVLQRIALSFILAAPFVLWLGRRGRMISVAALLLGYWAIETLVPFPGGTPGVLEPGQDISAYVDRAVYGMDHLWSGSRIFDPEGLLGTIPSAANVLLGVFAGELLRSGRPSRDIVRMMLIGGVVGIVAGMLWGQVFPLNKALWTSSFVLFTAGAATIGLALCYWLVDVKGYRWWTVPFMVFGVNAIATYALSQILSDTFSFENLPGEGVAATIKGQIFGFYSSFLPPHDASLAYAITFVLICLAIMYPLYRKRIYIKV